MRTNFYLFYFILLSCTNISQLKNVKDSDIESKNIQLYVNDTNGRSKVVEVNPSSCTLESLKKRLQDHNGVCWKRQKIYYGGTFLNKDDELLSKYGITQDAFLEHSFNLNGGVREGPDLTSCVESKATSGGGPSWISVFSGFNLAFECPNPNCPSHKDDYYNWVHIGEKGSYIYSKVLYDKFTCKACSQKIGGTKTGKIVKGFCFRSCNYKLEGINYGKSQILTHNSKKEQIEPIVGTAVGSNLKSYYGKGWIWWDFMQITIS